MKHYILLTLLMVLILTGCKAKTSFSLTFDTFTIKVYDKGKQYIALPTDTSVPGINVLKSMKEQIPITTGHTTGFINSLLIVKSPIQSGMNIQEFIDANNKTLLIKLIKYTSLTSTTKKLKCANQQYSGYITTFSYQLDNQELYIGQYYFIDDVSLYTISLSTDTSKDIDSFVKSIGTITCI